MAYKAKVNNEKCVSCGACVPVCPVAAIKIDGKAVIEEAKCIGCSACVPACPVEAIDVKNRASKPSSSPCGSCGDGSPCGEGSPCGSSYSSSPHSQTKASSHHRKTESTVKSDNSCCCGGFFGGEQGKKNMIFAGIALVVALFIIDMFYSSEE